MTSWIIIYPVWLLLLLKPANRPKSEKQNYLQIAFTTPQAPGAQKTEKQTQGCNQRFTAAQLFYL